MLTRFLLPACAASLIAASSALAQDTPPDTIVVFDGSGSMWGQIDGRTKIEIARETLSGVLSDVSPDQRIGMIAYGHREKGVCADIESIVPVDSAMRAVPLMIEAANALSPKGKTPLSDAVRMAAQDLRYTENAATVILVTDGIETCDADPCALATELEEGGIGFTAHVVGFGLSAEDGRQVQCLADNTGGLFLSANDADELGDALRQVVQAEVIPASEDDFGDALPATREVHFIFRDTPEGPQLGARSLSGQVARADGTPVGANEFGFAYPEASGLSAMASLEPGSYTGAFTREGGAQGGYSLHYAFIVPEGDGVHVIEASFAGALQLNVFINPDLPYTEGDPFPTAVGRSRPRFNFAVFEIVNGATGETPVAESTISNLTFPLPAGRYLVRGNIDSGTSVERVVTVQSGATTEFDFSFDATRVFIEAVEADGTRVKRQTTYWYDQLRSGRNYWVSGGGIADEQVVPFYLPTGEWLLNVGGEGYGARRSERIVNVPGDYRDLRLTVGEGEVLDADDQGYLSSPAYTGCVEILRVSYGGCLIERADLSEVAQQKLAEPNNAQNDHSSLLDGLSGTGYVFVDDAQNPVLHIVTSDGEATAVLADGWCPDPACTSGRTPLDPEDLSLLAEETFSAVSLSKGEHRFDISSFATEKEITVSNEAGMTRTLTLFDTVRLLPGVLAPPTEPEQEEPSLTERINRVIGVFVLDTSGQPIEQITADLMHSQRCQRRPVVMYADNQIAFKEFVEPQNAQDNPYKTTASGACTVTGLQFECTITETRTGLTETMAFSSEFLGDNHYSLQMKGENRPTLASACFHPGGALQAAEVMPNGRTLAELMTEREDGRTPRIGYDKNNNLFTQQ